MVNVCQIMAALDATGLVPGSSLPKELLQLRTGKSVYYYLFVFMALFVYQRVTVVVHVIIPILLNIIAPVKVGIVNGLGNGNHVVRNNFLGVYSSNVQNDVNDKDGEYAVLYYNFFSNPRGSDVISLQEEHTTIVVDFDSPDLISGIQEKLNDPVTTIYRNSDHQLTILVASREAPVFCRNLKNKGKAILAKGVVSGVEATLATITPSVTRILSINNHGRDISTEVEWCATDDEGLTRDSDSELASDRDSDRLKLKVKVQATAKHRKTFIYVHTESAIPKPHKKMFRCRTIKPLRIFYKSTGYSGAESSSDEGREDPISCRHSQNKTNSARLSTAKQRIEYQKGETDPDSSGEVVHKEKVERYM